MSSPPPGFPDAIPAPRGRPPAPRLWAWRFLALQALIWITYGVVYFAASIPAILPEEHGIMAIASAVRAFTGLVISTILVRVIAWKRFGDRGVVIALAAGAALVGGFAWMGVDRMVFVTLAAILQLAIPWERFVHGMDLGYLFVMLAWAAGYVALALLERTRDQREELLRQQINLRQAQLNLLAAQLNPHFLFNSLNTIRSLAAEDAEKTRDVVNRLASFLRRALSVDPAVLVPLEQEIALARDYLAVEQARLESGLAVSFDIATAANQCLVPALILQPLLENAVKHGDPGADGVRRITVSATAADNLLEIIVRNSGSLIPGPAGKGLELTRARLEQIYGPADAFRLSGEGDDTVATLILPHRPAS